MREKNILQILKNSRYTVVLSGSGLLFENGYPLLRDGEDSYEVEEKYGYSFEEIFSSGFYAVRKDLFFKFYKEVVLKASEIPPGEGFLALKRLQDFGLINSIITRRIAGLEDRAGCRNVINLKGTVFHNRCPSCNREYTFEYMKNSEGIPLCQECLTPIRPQVCLFGEMIDNGLMTKATEEVTKAEVLIVLGAALTTPLCSQLIQYYNGSNLILVNQQENYSDERADIVIHNRSDEFLKALAKEYEKEKD